MRDGGRTPFPSQIRVAWHGARLPELPESAFKHVVKYTAGNRFELSLSSAQVSTRELRCHRVVSALACGWGVGRHPEPHPDPFDSLDPRR